MKVSNVSEQHGFFRVLQTDERSQTATMRLEPGGASGEELNTHPNSDQVLLVVEGLVAAEVGGERKLLGRGDSVVVPAGVPHRFSNAGDTQAVTFNVYAPPAY